MKKTPSHGRQFPFVSLSILMLSMFVAVSTSPSLLEDPEMLEAVTRVNHQITRLAPVLNSATLEEKASVESANPQVPIAIMVKQFQGSTYLFAVAMRDGATRAMFSLKSNSDDKLRVEVIDEDRSLEVHDFTFRDQFEPWDAHLYRITAQRSGRPHESE